MKTENEEKSGKKGSARASDAMYGFGLIGALIYFIQHATSFGDGVLGFLKALVWPVLIVYNLLEHLKI